MAAIFKKLIWRDLHLKLFTRLANKKRAISPVISVILLIGLAVAAIAAIFIVVLPLLETTTNLQIDEAYIEYDDAYTIAADVGKGYGTGTLILSNAGTGEIEIVSLSVYYADSISLTANWTEIDNHDKKLDITKDNPYVIAPLAALEELTVRFLIPEDNNDKAISYKIIITTDEGDELDTAKVAIIDETEMQLEKDRPDISFTGTLGHIRRTQAVYPSSVSDNSEIKNVTYKITNGSSSWEMTTVVESTPWRFNWATYNTIDNGTYNMTMTVYDYAGLSKIADAGSLIIDNDYIIPVISTIVGSSIKNGVGIAEVGESYSIQATITDSGCAVSKVTEAWIYYKINNTGITTYDVSPMTQGAGNTWTGNVLAEDIVSQALSDNITYYITALDDDSNNGLTGDYFADVNDSTMPDITSHTPVSQVVDTAEGPTITLSVTVVDKDTVDSVTLVWRQRNDTGLLIPDPWQVSNYADKTGDTWYFTIPTVNVTVEGLNYYINASDPSGNTNDGSASSPYYIEVLDQTDPEVEFDPVIVSPTGPGQDVDLRVEVNDNDPSLSTKRFISETGTVEISYKIDSGDWKSAFSMTHTSGDSSLGEEGIWQATIDQGNFTQLTTVTIRVVVEDQSGHTASIETDVEVAEAGKPVFKYEADSVDVSGTSFHILEFDLKNYGTGGDAVADINNITVNLYNNTKGSYIGQPRLIEINATGAGITTPPNDLCWRNVSNPSEGTNGTLIPLDDNIEHFGPGEVATITLVYANYSALGYFNLNDLTVEVTVGFIYASATSSWYSDPSEATFDTPITNYIFTNQTRYMRSDSHTINGLAGYQFGTSQSYSLQTLNERTPRGSGSFDCEWTIEVYVRHSDSSQTDLTLGQKALVERTFDSEGYQSATWYCTGYDLDPTDAIIIQVHMTIGSYSYGPVTFITEQLNAEELSAGYWTIRYHTERDYSGWPQTRTRGIYSWGDSTTHISRITGFAFSSPF